MANGDSFQNVAGLKKLPLNDERQIAGNMARQFIAYGTGAPVTFGDRAEVETHLAPLEGWLRMRSIVEQIVQSELFTHK